MQIVITMFDFDVLHSFSLIINGVDNAGDFCAFITCSPFLFDSKSETCNAN